MAHSQTAQDSNSSSFRSAPFSLWLSWQELNGRKVIFFINVILVAFLIALPVSLDLIGKARKSSVNTRVDYIGPSLILVPEGILSSDLVTGKLKGKTFPDSVFESVKKDAAPFVRNSEKRLTLRLSVEGRSLPATGIDFSNVYSYPFNKHVMSSREVLLGPVAADNLGKAVNDTVRIQSETYTISGIIPTSGGIEDVSVFLPLAALQKMTGLEGRINEIHIFPASSSSYEQLKSDLKKHSDNLNVVDAYRGDTAEKGIDTALLNYQKALYTAAFILIAICIMISTYINLESRKSEVSTVYTLGATQGIIFQILTFRTIWITFLGSLSGLLIAYIVTALQDIHVPLSLIWSTGSFIEVIIGTVCLGVLVTIPFTLYSVYKRNPVAYL